MSKKQISPVHPGLYLKEIIDELRISQSQLAQSIGISSMRISHLIRGKRPVTAEIALRLGRYLGQSPQYWLNLQCRYDMDVAEDRYSEQVIREIRPLGKVV